MRLTLRTLLAYLDDVLDPADREELAQKIGSSEFAEDLVHRTRDTVRRLRLSAPQVIGTGMGLDPNSVAEYLDNVMPPEQVGDFERICLESDVHLAEATACHHVLTMVLGSPADVDPLARQRMYKILGEIENRKQLRIEPPHTTPPVAAIEAAVAAAQAAAVPPAAAERPHRAEVPDYLRAGAWWRSANAVIGLAALVLVGTGVVLFTGLSGWFGGKTDPATLVAERAAPMEEDSTAVPSANVDAPSAQPAAAPANEPGGARDVAATADAGLASPPPPTTPGLPQPATAPAGDDRYAVPGNAAPVATEQPATSATTAPTPPANGTSPSVPPAPAPPNTAGPDPARPLIPPAATAPAGAAAEAPQLATAGSAAPEQPSLPPVPPTTETPLPDAPPPSLAAANPTPPPGLPAAPPTEPAAAAVPPQALAPPAAPPDSGTYMGGKTVLLRLDDQAGSWFRVEPRSPVVPGERLLSLPEFRPRIALTSGLQLDLSGGTQIVVGNAAAAEARAANAVVPTIELVYGRLVLVNPTSAELPVHLKLGPASGTAKLVRNAVLGVQVERKFVPGSDPRTTPAPVETRLFAPDGGVVWQDAAGEKTVDKGAQWMLTEAGAGEFIADATLPAWIDHEPVVQKSEQVYGAPVIESTLVTSAPAETQLLELFGRKDRKEVKSLATRCSIHVGLFQPFIDALRDSEQKASWKNHIDTLRDAMALSPESANKVYQTLVEQRGKPAAADLYEMLCSYNAEQIGTTPEAMKTGALLKLIDWLEDDSLDYRVLAVHDLQEVTGKRLMPNPAAGLAERTQNVRRWRSRLEVGDLKPVSAKAE